MPGYQNYEPAFIDPVMEKCFFTLSLQQGSITTCMTLGILEHKGLAELGTDCLSVDEQQLYTNFKADRRRSEFLGGRYIAKESVRHENPDIPPQLINIVHGVWGFPLIHTRSLHKATISIGHTDRCAAAIFSSSNTIPVGIDIEEIKQENLRAFTSFITKSEQELIRSGQLPYREAMHLIWSSKEAAGKALRVGFTIPENLYAISSIKQTDGLYHVSFEKLGMLQVIGWVYGDFSICIAFPSVWNLGKIKRRTTE